MPWQSYIAKEHRMTSCNVAEDKLALLLGGNTNGDFKLKPLLVYDSENPRTLKGYTKINLPTIWKSSKKHGL
jgi:hypothetical protein